MKNDSETKNKILLNETLISGRDLLFATGGFVIGNRSDVENLCFTSVVTDSRNVKQESLFVPLIGEFQDGHKYIPQSIENGASVVFVAKKIFEAASADYELMSEKNPNVFFISVENTLYALQNAAEFYVKQFPNLIRVSITGSSGKTTVKEIAAAILSQKYKTVANKGNLNSETGLPLSVFEISRDDEAAIFEAGMNRKNEIAELAKVFKPQFALITNIGNAHIGKLGSRKNIAEEKRKIFSYIEKNGAAFIPADDDFADFLAENVKGKIVFYGNCGENEIEFVSDDGFEGTTFKIEGLTVHCSIPGKYNFHNALAAIALSKELKASAEQIKIGIEKTKPLGSRNRLLKGKYLIFEDCYNANPDSMKKCMEFCDSVDFSGNKFFVLGDMLELGDESENEHRKIGELAAKIRAKMIVFFGNEMKFAFEQACAFSDFESENREKFVFVQGNDEAAIKSVFEKINENICVGDFILLKGSRGTELERLIPLFEEGK